MNIIIGPLEAFYIVGAILALTLVILFYPTLKYGPKDDEEEKNPRKSHKIAKS